MLCDNSDSPGYAEHHEVLFHILIIRLCTCYIRNY